jgi:hypothetical protein
MIVEVDDGFLGAHESVSGGLHLAFDRVRQVGGDF